MQANQLRPGKTIVHDGALHTVVQYVHRAPGNKRAFVQVTLRNLENGKLIQRKFSATEYVESAQLEGRRTQYLYCDDSGYYFMDQTEYETHRLGDDIVGEKKNFLKENEEVKMYFYGARPVEIELPPKVALEVAESPEWVKGDSVSNNMKPAVLETGMKIMVPLFVKQGTRILVDTRTGEYISRE